MLRRKLTHIHTVGASSTWEVRKILPKYGNRKPKLPPSVHAAGRTRRSRGCSCTHAYKHAFTQSQSDMELTTAARPRCREGQCEDRMQMEGAVTPGKTLGGEDIEPKRIVSSLLLLLAAA